MSRDKYYITQTDADEFDMIYPMIVSMYKEMKDLSSKKADGALNKLKIKMINRLLDAAQKLLEDHPTVKFLEILDDDVIPQNSDVTLILKQYIDALIQFRSDHIDHAHRWNIED